MRTMCASDLDDSVAPLLHVEAAAEPGGVTISLIGELDLSTTDLVTDRAERLLPGIASGVLAVDLGGVTFMCANGVRVLLELQDLARVHGSEVRLRNPSPPVLRVLSLTSTLDFFHLTADPGPSGAPGG